MRKVDVIVDLQYGNTGKGLFAGWLAKRMEYDTVICANMPNAGHTFINDAGEKFVHKVLPCGFTSLRLRNLMIGPNAIFSPEQLKRELAHMRMSSYPNAREYGVHVLIHRGAMVLTEEDVVGEEGNEALGAIASTRQGTTGAIRRNIMRQGLKNDLEKVLEEYNMEANVVSDHQWMRVLKDAGSILIEGCQGYSLGVNTDFYPYVTSKDCTPARYFMDCGVPIQWLRTVYGTMRTFPIRVGCSSGDCYSDQKELKWEDFGVRPEKTTVMSRDRRIFSFSKKQLEAAIDACEPDVVFINFMNYLDKDNFDTFLRIKKVLYSRGIFNIRQGWGPTEGEIGDDRYLIPDTVNY